MPSASAVDVGTGAVDLLEQARSFRVPISMRATVRNEVEKSSASRVLTLILQHWFMPLWLNRQVFCAKSWIFEAIGLQSDGL